MKNVNLLAGDLDFVLKSTANLVNDFYQKRIFITGGTGFFGCWLLESFMWANEKLGLDCKITVLTRDPSGFRSKMPHLAKKPAITLHEGDVINFSVPEGPFDFVIHAATEASAEKIKTDPVGMISTIVKGTFHTLEFARLVGAKRFLLTSSGAVYGTQPSAMEKISESYLGGPDSCNPGFAYGQAKRLAEQLCTSYTSQYGLDCTIARCFAFVGPYLPLDIHYAVGNFIRDALSGGPIQVNGDGTPFRSYLYPSDLVIWLWTILLKGRPGYAYNVGSDRSLTILELAKAVASCFNPQPEITVANKANPNAHIERYVPDISRAGKELSLRVNVDLEEALQKTVDYHLSLKKI